MQSKIVIVLLILVLGIFSSSIPALSKDSDDKSKDSEDDDDHSEKNNEDDKSKDNTKDKIHKSTSNKTEIRVKTSNDISFVKVEIEFITRSKDKQSILQDILDRAKLDETTVSDLIDIEKGSEDKKESIEVKADSIGNVTSVKFEYRFVVNSIEKNVIISSIVDKLSTLDIDENDIILESETRKSKKDSIYKLKSNSNPDLVNSIENAEKFVDRRRAIVFITIGLEPNDGSISFGSAKLGLIKTANKEANFRANIHVVIDGVFDIVTACIDGKPLGELEIVNEDESMVTIGKLKANIQGLSLTIPGTTIDVVEGSDCSNNIILSGSI